MAVDILKISKDAREAAKIYPDVINASIGMFYDEDKKIGGMPIVSNAIRNLLDEEILPYPAVDGGALFKSNLVTWVFGKYEDDIKKSFYVNACATPGGSGAIASTFSIFSKPGESIFVSDIRWQYERFADRAKLNCFEHKLFDGDGFNMTSFKERLDELCQQQKRVIVIVNDPCHNPTGFTLSQDEFSQILDILNAKKENDIIFLYDLAYLEFSHETDNRKKLSLLTKLEENVTTVIAFSGSKTFGVYGLRLGAAIYLSKNEQLIKDVHLKFVNEARGSWSATPTASIELFNQFSIEKNKEVFHKDLDKINTLVQKRSQLFISQAQAIGLKTHPFRSGFYTVVLTNDPDHDYLKLAEHHIYAVPMNGGVRFALCSLSLKEIDGLPLKIKSILHL
ncbi:MAG: aminotransferase class I/II-fold pyridoxal phosphate-dependent enzyme [Acholeplasmataceae bacterium]|nr:aminotransferase class I/II-fold pyridoxal phosphate-dependent enzyme [Acholeplasmataceae bacterium]